MKPKIIKISCSGYSVFADWYAGNKKNQILLFLIGYGSNRKKQADLVNALVTQTGSSVLVLEYSGHGDSPFKLNDTMPAQHFLEVVHAFDWIKETHPMAKLNVLGASYGGFLAAQLTKYRKFEKLILRVPAIYRPEDFYTLQPALHQEDNREYRKYAKEIAKHPLFKRVAEFKGKTLVVVHGRDEAIPKQTTDAFIKAFGADVYNAPWFWHSLGDPRNPKDKLPEYQKAISDWIKK